MPVDYSKIRVGLSGVCRFCGCDNMVTVDHSNGIIMRQCRGCKQYSIKKMKPKRPKRKVTWAECCQ